MPAYPRRLAALAVFGVFALFSPLTGAFSRSATVLGVPVLPVYLFAVWTLLVLVAWGIFRGRGA